MDQLISKYSLWCFIATLVTIVALSICGTIAASKGQDSTLYATAIAGLIGVIGTFKPRSGAMNTVQNADNVNQGPNSGSADGD